MYYYPFPVKWDRCVGSCNILNDLSSQPFAPNTTEDLNVHVFNMITEKSESKILTKDISCAYKCKSDGRKCNSSEK